jgi:hypothetical protein
VIEIYRFGPLELEMPTDFERADLEFYGVNHFRPSFTARVYLNDPEVTAESATEDRARFAGSFSVFGHQSCVGDEGHCEVHPHARRFDDRPSHPLTRAFKRVTVTDTLRTCMEAGDPITVTVVAASDPRAELDFDGPLLDFEGMQIATFD